MTDLNTKMNLLIEELYNYFIFYVPKPALMHLFDEYSLDKDKLPLLEPYIEKVTYIEQGEWYSFQETPFELGELTFKMNNLSKNVVQLFDLKENLQPESFNFILKKYREQLTFHFTVATLLVENYEKYCVEKSKEVIDILQFQLGIISKHKTEIANHFETLQHVANKFNNLQLPDLNSLKREITKPDSEVQNFLLNKKPKKKKLSKEDAVSFLLKTVFSKKG